MAVLESALPLASRPAVAGSALRTHVGMTRERNEDASYADPGHRFFIVADGMGGHAAGDVASAMAVDGMRQVLQESAEELDLFACAPSESGRMRIRALLENAIRAINAEVLMRGLREPDKRGMGTTLDVVLILADEAFIAHVGDCRTYLFRDRFAFQATVDHTVAQAMHTAGRLSAEEAAQSPMRSVLSNSMGACPNLIVDHVTIELEPGDRLLLCSDGLYDYFTADELARCVTNHHADRALAELIDRACVRGGHDNLTGIIVEVGTQPAPRPTPTRPTRAGRRSRGPLSGVDDTDLGAFVEHALFESSKPHRLPSI